MEEWTKIKTAFCIEKEVEKYGFECLVKSDKGDITPENSAGKDKGK